VISVPGECPEKGQGALDRMLAVPRD